MRLCIPLLTVLLVLASCDRPASPPVEPPPRATDPIVFDREPSTVAIDMKVDLAGLERELEAGIPRTLWRISQEDVVCVPSKKVDLGLFKIKTPKIKCDIDGKVTRGRLKFSGQGNTLTVVMPIKAKVVARDIGGILKRETGTGALDLRLRLSFDLRPDWRLKSKARIDYSWSQEPGFDFLGRRIKLTKDADKALAELQRRVEADMERALARVKLRAAAERGWRSAHAVLELNRENPAVWVRIAPQRFHYGGYRIAGKTMYMTLGIQGTLESHIGAKPPATDAGPLPPIEPLEIKPGFALLKVPVVADYAVLEPVLAKALS
jgi:hypothetical protein